MKRVDTKTRKSLPKLKVGLKIIVLTIVGVTILTAVLLVNNYKKLTISDFDFLEKGISYSEIVKKVGKPSDNVGSGLYIFTYRLSDGRTVSISFADLDHLQDARLHDPTTKENVSLVNYGAD